ncbi:MAG: hypothetical protein QHC65_04160 [Sphingomonas sp.]|nr:hypothetical protein [Sphingomonas sp.]MDX3883592.1 hypothetical protein [Sphingomonas sp.]
MATIELEEYGAPASRYGAKLPIAPLPAANVRQIASGAGATLGTATVVIAVTADADVRIRVGRAGAADSSDPLVKAGMMRWFEVQPRQTIRFD